MARASAVSEEKKLTSEQLAQFQDALDTLYIVGNISGRLNFVRNWPHAASHILGEQLLEFDREGTPDRELRASLEDEAEGRRLDLLEILETLQNKSVDRGTLQLEYVKNLVLNLGRDLALYIYSDHIVDRFIAPPVKVVEEVKVEEVKVVQDVRRKAYTPQVIEATIPTPPPTEEFTPTIQEDALAAVQPINVGPPIEVVVLNKAPAAPAPEAPTPLAAAPVDQDEKITFVSSKKKAPEDVSGTEQ